MPRQFHRWIGAILLLPCIVWAVTGLLFHWKPGWDEAYASLEPRNYPLPALEIPPDPDWKEIRVLRTILGPHLLVQTKDGWQHLDPVRGTTRPEPAEPDRITLFEDAFRENPERYGKVDSTDGWTARTSTGIDVTLDWNRMRFHQRGSDTRRIDLLYRLHYLQWTGTEIGDRILPLIGLIGLLSLAMLGLKLLRR